MHDLVLFFGGIVVGVMNAIAGGGMLIGFPILIATGLSPLVANITSHVIVLPGTLASAYGYRRYIKKVPQKYLYLLIPCILGGMTGAFLLRRTSSAHFQEIVPFLIVSAVILFALQPYLHFKLNKHIRSQIKAVKPLAVIALAIFPVAVYGGYFGAGFGFIMLAFLGFTKLHEFHQMNGLKNLASSCISIASITVLFSTHLINWRYAVIMACGCLIGGYYGAIYSQKVSSHYLRITVILIGLSTAAYLAIHRF